MRLALKNDGALRRGRRDLDQAHRLYAGHWRVFDLARLDAGL
jgi:hypothetical protein